MQNLQKSLRYFEETIDPVTGKIRREIQKKYKIKAYLLSFLCHSPFLLVSLFILVSSLNIRGYMNPNHKLLFCPFLYSFSEPDGIFDKNTNYIQIPNVLHVVIFNVLAIYY